MVVVCIGGFGVGGVSLSSIAPQMRNPHMGSKTGPVGGDFGWWGGGVHRFVRYRRFSSLVQSGGHREFNYARHAPFWGPRQQGFPLGEIPQRAGETRTGTTDKPHGAGKAGKGTPDKRRNGVFPKWFRFWRSKWFRVSPGTHKTAKDQGLELGEIPYRGKSPG